MYFATVVWHIDAELNLTKSRSGGGHTVFEDGRVGGVRIFSLTGELAVIPWLYMANHFWGD
jgi:hypothetical protein